eukprot:SM000007S20998  [mRNA]  locus=s7:1303263:1307521:- [translate_table: standard]
MAHGAVWRGGQRLRTQVVLHVKNALQGNQCTTFWHDALRLEGQVVSASRGGHQSAPRGVSTSAGALEGVTACLPSRHLSTSSEIPWHSSTRFRDLYPSTCCERGVRLAHDDARLVQRAAAAAARRKKSRQEARAAENWELYSQGSAETLTGSPLKEALRGQQDNPSVTQPAPSQPLVGELQPASPQEARLAPVLARPDLIITRQIEWGTVLIGYEQRNVYNIVDPRQGSEPVGHIMEQPGSFLLRQFVGIRRPLTALVTDAIGNTLVTIRRPFWLINSRMYIEIDGEVVGEVHRRWHLWKRIYDVYLGNKQFATLENAGFWWWTFTLEDNEKRKLAEIDRNFRGIGYEFLTDAGQYVVRFGDIVPGGHSPQAQGKHWDQLDPVPQLEVIRPLTLTERAITMALAVSLDNDYFSRHSGGGIGMPIPFFGGASEAASSHEEQASEASSAPASTPPPSASEAGGMAGPAAGGAIGGAFGHTYTADRSGGAEDAGGGSAGQVASEQSPDIDPQPFDGERLDDLGGDTWDKGLDWGDSTSDKDSESTGGGDGFFGSFTDIFGDDES